ncbi:hypothetical protein BASA50_004027 [Batrachochytrium salamandrivorans]|uniref:TRAM domain-containing protein n=1 Tax=Batrachochytrium salamandrivorans TaxID=1357716 RepID=A0ABQ8FH08_9FUNG|nr:hypothetical protein BASA50_004027 [Batrachochytrium salamandrivorans]
MTAEAVTRHITRHITRHPTRHLTRHITIHLILQRLSSLVHTPHLSHIRFTHGFALNTHPKETLSEFLIRSTDTKPDPISAVFDRQSLAESLKRLLPHRSIPYLRCQSMLLTAYIASPDPLLLPPVDVACTTDQVRVILANKAMGTGIAVGKNNWLYMVPAVLVNETITVHVYKHMDGISLADLVDVIHKSPDRVQPPCRYYDKCNGCQLMHLKLETQLTIKQDLVSTSFQPILTRLELEGLSSLDRKLILPIVSSPESLGYRSSIKIHHEQVPAGETISNVGLIAKGRRFNVTDIEECVISNDTLNAGLAALRHTLKLVRNHGSTSSKSHSYPIRSTLTLPNHQPLSYFLPAFIKARNEAHLAALQPVVSNKKVNSLVPLASVERAKDILNSWTSTTLSAPLSLFTVVIENVVIQSHVCDNTQENMGITLLILQHIRSTIEHHLPACDRTWLIDLYAGSGLFGLLLSHMFKRVVGIEMVVRSSSMSAVNAIHNQIYNYRAFPGLVEDQFEPVVRKTDARQTVVFVNPPERGLSVHALDRIKSFGPRLLIMLHSKPSVQSKDIAYLLGHTGEKQSQSVRARHGSGSGRYNQTQRYSSRTLSSKPLFNLDRQWDAPLSTQRTCRLVSVTPFDHLPHTKEVMSLAVLVFE